MVAEAISGFGTLNDGGVVEAVALQNSAGMTARILTYGAILQALETPDRQATLGDIVLGYRTLEEYVARPQFFGATIGRYANRIKAGRFRLDGHDYQVPATDGDHALHGGRAGFDKRLWTITSHSARAVTLRRLSEDGEEGFPGALEVELTYAMGDDNTLTIDFTARTDRATVVNLTNHSYFNLGGEGSGSALDHILTIAADQMTPVDATLIPTGEIIPVAGTALDFRMPRRISERIRDAGDTQIARARGYDFNYVLRDGVTTVPHPAIRVEDPGTGRVLTIETTEPGVQFYSGNFLDATTTGKSGRVYRQGDGLAFETQHFPDSPNHPQFPTTRLEPGVTWRTTTIWRFTTSTSA